MWYWDRHGGAGIVGNHGCGNGTILMVLVMRVLVVVEWGVVMVAVVLVVVVVAVTLGVLLSVVVLGIVLVAVMLVEEMVAVVLSGVSDICCVVW